MRINRAVFFILLVAATIGTIGAFVWGTSVGDGRPLYQHDDRSEFYTPGSENHIAGLHWSINLHTSADNCFFEGSTGAGGNLDRIDAEAWSTRGAHCSVEVMADTGRGFVALTDDKPHGMYFANGIIQAAAFRFCNTDGASITDDDCNIYLLTRGGGRMRFVE